VITTANVELLIVGSSFWLVSVTLTPAMLDCDVYIMYVVELGHHSP